MCGSMLVLFCHWMLMNLWLGIFFLALSVLFFLPFPFRSFDLCYESDFISCWNRLIFYISLNIQNKFSIFETFIHIQIRLQGSEYFDWTHTKKNMSFFFFFCVLIIPFEGNGLNYNWLHCFFFIISLYIIYEISYFCWAAYTVLSQNIFCD